MPQYAFVCPDCTQAIAVNEQMKAAIIDRGCPVCTGQVGEENFEADDDELPES